MKTILNQTKMKHLLWLFIMLPLIIFSCKSELDDEKFESSELQLKVSEITQMSSDLYKSNFNFSWTSANNLGTSSSINYTLEIDKAGNDFKNSIEYELGQNIYTYDINLNALNNILIDTFQATPDNPIALQARIVATFGDSSVQQQISTVDFSLTPYYPLSETLYIVGDASPNGWDISKAIELTSSSSDVAEFTYLGNLVAGEFKFSVNTNSCFCQDFYTKDAVDDTKMVLNIAGSGNDLKWKITEPGLYKIKANIGTRTISVEKQTTPSFSKLWIVGDATESGWNVDSPLAFNSTDDAGVFSLETELTAGTFKILAGATGDWCGNWFRPLKDNQSITETTMQQTSGCGNDDYKWQVTSAQAGRYKIEVNILNNTIKITPVSVYLIGDATPNGWNMGSLSPMTKTGNVYTWTGNLVAGDFKFTKFNTDWCGGEEIVAATADQSYTNTNFSIRNKCSGPDDNKWKISAAQTGNFTITIDLKSNTLKITKN